MMHKKYQNLATCFIAHQNCKDTNSEWFSRWENQIKDIIDSLPHGSGIDGKTEFDFEKSKEDKLIIHSQYHFMDENGFYDGWGDFDIILKPSWVDVDLTISGKFPKKYDIIKDYLHQQFDYDLNKDHEFSF